MPFSIFYCTRMMKMFPSYLFDSKRWYLVVLYGLAFSTSLTYTAYSCSISMRAHRIPPYSDIPVTTILFPYSDCRCLFAMKSNFPSCNIQPLALSMCWKDLSLKKTIWESIVSFTIRQILSFFSITYTTLNSRSSINAIYILVKDYSVIKEESSFLRKVVRTFGSLLSAWPTMKDGGSSFDWEWVVFWILLEMVLVVAA